MARVPVRALVVMGLSLSGVLGACSPMASRYDVTVRPEPAVVASPTHTVEVDLVGVNAEQEAAWAPLSMTEYFLPGSPARAAVLQADAVRMVFGPGQTTPQRLSQSDPAWAAWRARGARKLLVLANLPGGFVDQPGGQDPRRLFVSLSPREWEVAAERGIEIELRPTGLTARPPKE